jgi:hypothetical protein
MLRSELARCDPPTRHVVLLVGLGLLAVGGIFALANHLWHDDQRERLLSTRADVMKFGAATIGTSDEPCIVRDGRRWDCEPRTILIETSVEQYRLLQPTNFFGPGLEGWSITPNPAHTSTVIGVYATYDTTKMTFDPCEAKSVPVDQRFVAEIVDEAHHRTVYVPCEGMVYVVPDETQP